MVAPDFAVACFTNLPGLGSQARPVLADPSAMVLELDRAQPTHRKSASLLGCSDALDLAVERSHSHQWSELEEILTFNK